MNMGICNKYVAIKIYCFGESQSMPLLYGGRTSLAIYLATYGVCQQWSFTRERKFFCLG